MIPLIRCQSGLDVKTTEATRIQKWSPVFNFPFILRMMPTKTTSSTNCRMNSLAMKYGVPGTRIFRKLRRRLFHTMNLHLYRQTIFRDDHQWHGNFQLADNSSRSFKMARSLRSAQYSTDQLFALHRLSNNLADPPRSKVRGLQKIAITFKSARLPSKAKAISLPVLAHRSFTGNVRAWLRRIVIDRKDFLTPCHLPVCSVVAGKFPTMDNKLYLHFKRVASPRTNLPMAPVISYVPPLKALNILLRKPDFSMFLVVFGFGSLAVLVLKSIPTLKSIVKQVGMHLIIGFSITRLVVLHIQCGDSSLCVGGKIIGSLPLSRSTWKTSGLFVQLLINWLYKVVIMPLVTFIFLPCIVPSCTQGDFWRT